MSAQGVDSGQILPEAGQGSRSSEPAVREVWWWLRELGSQPRLEICLLTKSAAQARDFSHGMSGIRLLSELESV